MGWLKKGSGFVGVLVCVLAVLSSARLRGEGAAEGESMSPDLGFSGLEVYKIDADTRNLQAAEINGDGLIDLVVADNSRARIEILLQRPASAIKAAAEAEIAHPERLVNDFPPGARFERRPLLIERKIYSLKVGDLNGDGRPDIVYYGDPKALVCVYQAEDGGWSPDEQVFDDIKDGSTAPTGLDIGDIDGDGRLDIALLGQDSTYLVYQDTDGELLEPVELSHSAGEITGIKLFDLDGDGRRDLLTVRPSSKMPVLVRFDGPSGFGPEVPFDLPAFRAWETGDLDGDKADEILVIHPTTGRLKSYSLSREAPVGKRLGAPLLFALDASNDVRNRSFATGDVDGDGKLDLLASDPAAAEIILFRGPIAEESSFPTLADAREVGVGDLDGDGKAEVVVMSRGERTLGVSRWDGERITFPRTVGVKGEPRCMTVDRLSPTARPEAIFVSKEDAKQFVRAYGGQGAGAVRDVREISGTKGSPEAIRVFDVNADGRSDILLYYPYDPLKILVQSPDGTFTDATDAPGFSSGLVQGVAATSFATGVVEKSGAPRLFVTKGNFARAISLRAAADNQTSIEVVDQYNGRDATSEIVAAAPIDIDADGVPEIALVDRSTWNLEILSKAKDGTYAVSEEVPIGALQFKGLHVGDFTGDGADDLLVAGGDRFVVVSTEGRKFGLVPTASYETPVKDGMLSDVAVGDLSGDGVLEVIATEGSRHLLEILQRKPPDRFARGLYFPVFEEKRLGGSPSSGGHEPREIVVADVTGDGKKDLILLIHDRVIVYPNE